jgi:UDP-glucose 4-epimerase
MRVLITGCGGFVGRHAALALAAAGEEVTALVRGRAPPTLQAQPGLRVVSGDLTRSEALPRGPYDAAIHCAAAIPARIGDESELLRINVEIARNVFAHAIAAGAKRIVFCSSMAAYGTIDCDWVDPDTPVRDPGVYGRSKIEAENLLARLCDREPSIGGLALRLPGVVGAGSHDNFLSDTMARLVAGESVVARNPDAPFNNVIHIADLASFMGALVRSLPTGCRLATIASDDPLPIRGVIEILEAAAEEPGAVQFEVGGRPFLISSESARGLGYRPATVRDSVTRFAADVIALARAGASARPSNA